MIIETDGPVSLVPPFASNSKWYSNSEGVPSGILAWSVGKVISSPTYSQSLEISGHFYSNPGI